MNPIEQPVEQSLSQNARDRWLQTMQTCYRLIGRERHSLGQDYRQPDAEVAEAYVEVYTFLPIARP